MGHPRLILMFPEIPLQDLAQRSWHNQKQAPKNGPDWNPQMLFQFAISSLLTLFVVPVLYTLLKPRQAAEPTNPEGVQ